MFNCLRAGIMNECPVCSKYISNIFILRTDSLSRQEFYPKNLRVKIVSKKKHQLIYFKDDDGLIIAYSHSFVNTGKCTYPNCNAKIVYQIGDVKYYFNVVPKYVESHGMAINYNFFLMNHTLNHHVHNCSLHRGMYINYKQFLELIAYTINLQYNKKLCIVMMLMINNRRSKYDGMVYDIPWEMWQNIILFL